MPQRKRRFARSKPDRDKVAFIYIAPEPNKEDPDGASLVLDESLGGCCIAVRPRSFIKPGSVFLLMKDHEILQPAQIVWFKWIDSEVCRTGLKFLGSDSTASE